MIYCIKSTDIEAPVLNGRFGSLIPVLNFALNLDAGDRGWEQVFLDTPSHKMVIRSTDPNANPYWYQLNDFNTNASYQQWAFWNGYDQGMSAIDSGNNKWGHPIEHGYWLKSRTSDTVARPWVCIFDSRFIWLCVATEASQPNRMSYWGIGDLVSSSQNSSVIVGTYTAYSSYNQCGLTMGSVYSCFARNIAGTVVNPPITDHAHLKSVITGSAERKSNSYPIGTSNSPRLLHPHGIYEAATWLFRGFYPGIYFNENSDGYLPHLGEITMPNGKAGLIVKSHGWINVEATAVFDLEGPWR